MKNQSDKQGIKAIVWMSGLVTGHLGDKVSRLYSGRRGTSPVGAVTAQVIGESGGWTLYRLPNRQLRHLRKASKSIRNKKPNT